MIDFKDWDGDLVRGGHDDGQMDLMTSKNYYLTLSEGVSYAVLNPAMARALAADLIAFADRAETEVGT